MTLTTTSLPPGPRSPKPFQTLAMLTRQRPSLERARRRYGNVFSIRVLNLGTFVVVAERSLVKQVFTADPTVLHAGTGSPLGTVLGEHSLLAIDEGRHLEQRKLLLPPFHGQRMQAYEGLIADIAREEIRRWPTGVEIATAEPFMRITLRAILRAVFGAEGAEVTELERLVPPFVESGSRMASVGALQRDLGPRSPWGRFVAHRAAVDRALDGLITRARHDDALDERTDVLSLLVRARHSDGSPMADAEIRDQLITLLAAGHETTAGTLSWAVERIRRHPELAVRLTEEVDAGGRTLRDATIREVQRVRPVIGFSGRFVRSPYLLDGHLLPVRTRIGLSAGLTHFDPELFPDPERFLPDRFLGVAPETYSWIPFGGGVRRCIGAAFAHMEMDVVLRTLLEHVTIAPDPAAPDEPWAFRGVAHVPGRGGRITVRARTRPRPRAAAVAPPLAAV